MIKREGLNKINLANVEKVIRDLIDVMRAKLKIEKDMILEVEKSNMSFASNKNGFSDPNLYNLNEEST